MSNAAKKALGVNRGIAKSALGGRLGIVKQAGGARKGTLGGRLGGKAQKVQQMGYAGKKTRVPVPDADSADTWGHDLYYASGYAATPKPLRGGGALVRGPTLPDRCSCTANYHSRCYF